MDNVLIEINKKTRQVFLTNSVIGNDGENLQENLVFSFNDEFVDGTGRLELIKPDKGKSYIMLTKVNETYELPVKSVITKSGKLNLQLVITEGSNDEEIPIFKSNKFYLVVNSSINAEIEEPDEYPQWIDVANTKLNEIDEAIQETSNLNIDINKEDNVATITLTDKEGRTKEVQILDGEQGEQGIQGETGPAGADGKDGKDGADGKDALINGVNTINIEAGENISINQSGDTLTINSTGGGSSDYEELENLPKINNVELKGNKTTSDLGIVIPTNSDFTLNGLSEKSYNNLTDKPTIPTVPTNVSAFTNDAGYTTNTGTITSVKMNGSTVATSGEADLGTVLTQHQDISGKQDIMQYSTMPTATSETVGKIVQYIGTTTTQAPIYTNGYFYIGIDTSGVYSWKQLEVQPNASGGFTGNLLERYKYSNVYDGNEFIFENNETGVYFENKDTSSVRYFRYKRKTTDTFVSLPSTLCPLELFYYKDIKNLEVSENTYFATLLAIDTSGNFQLYNFYLTSNNTISTNNKAPVESKLLTQGTQSFDGEKTFNTIPKQSNTNAPTNNQQFTNKKYVNDQDIIVSGNLATAYSSSSTYNEGDYCVYQNKLYKCNTTISTAEEWTSAHWTQTTVMSEINTTIGGINTILATLTTPSNGGGE